MILDGKALSNQILLELKDKVSTFKRKPCLVVISVGNDIGSESYVRGKEKTALQIGINFKHLKYDQIEEEVLINTIKNLNNDLEVDGIIVQLPLPKNLNEDIIINSIDPSKDVDGLTNINNAHLLNNNGGFIPCTPLGILTILKHYSIKISGANVVIVGRSRLVGKPLSILLLNHDATVTICHSKTTDLKRFTSEADILVVAVGKPSLITAKMVKKGSTVIDVGINRIDGKLIGDVDYLKVMKKAKYITPVPGGIGPMTVAMLMQNTINSYEKKMS